MIVVLVDKLLKTQIVECAAVANWIFSKEMMADFTKSYVWEVLHLTIRLNYILSVQLYFTSNRNWLTPSGKIRGLKFILTSDIVLV